MLPIWLTMHYRSVNRSSRNLSEEDRETVEQMLVTVDKLTDRIESLESILDIDRHGGVLVILSGRREGHRRQSRVDLSDRPRDSPHSGAHGVGLTIAAARGQHAKRRIGEC